jgi:hypothetical protein
VQGLEGSLLTIGVYPKKSYTNRYERACFISRKSDRKDHKRDRANAGGAVPTLVFPRFLAESPRANRRKFPGSRCCHP